MNRNDNSSQKKLALINEFKRLSTGKTPEQILPLIMAVNQKAKSMGIVFNNDDMEDIIKILKPNMSDAEKKQIQSMMKMMSMMPK